MSDIQFADVELSVSEFVVLFNQTIEFAFPFVTIIGELSNFRINRNQWVYFDLKDESSSVKFFGTVFNLPGPLEDGMLVRVYGQPRLHPLYGFSITFQTISPSGEGSLKKAAELLQRKLAAEGLFDDSRKRAVPYPPASIGLVTSKQSAAYADFIKILDARWQGVAVYAVDVQVQGDVAPAQIAKAIARLSAMAGPPDVIVLIRGGGSAEDLAAFSTEQVVRAVAGSRVPTLVAIGHEIDLSLAELAADRRASTPSNAAELLTPDRAHVAKELGGAGNFLRQSLASIKKAADSELQQSSRQLGQAMRYVLDDADIKLRNRRMLLEALSPEAVLRRGYAIVRKQKRFIRSKRQVSAGDIVEVTVTDGGFTATVNDGDK